MMSMTYPKGYEDKRQKSDGGNMIHCFVYSGVEKGGVCIIRAEI